MTQPQYIDISAANPALSDWEAYKQWAAQWDGVSRVKIKLTEGTGYVSAANHAQMAQQVGIDSIIWYHYARPDVNGGWQGAQAEVNFFRAHLPPLRPNDYVSFDYEGFPGVPDAPWLPDWCWDACHLFSENAGLSGSHIAVYSYLDFITRKLQYEPLNAFQLELAQYNNAKSDSPLPAAPSPWSSYLAWQYTDHGQVPGVVGYVDVNVWNGPTGQPPVIDIPGAIADLQSALKKLGG